MSSINAQTLQRTQPKWWFGESAAANLNVYRGNMQMLNSSLTVPTAFHTGQSVRPYASLLAEYRPNKRWGGMLNVAYDNRGGKYDQVMAPCNCAADLKTNLSYLTIEPSIRFAPFASGFYIFAGPTISINLTKDFLYTQEKQTDTRADLSDIRKLSFSAQAGIGIDFPVSARNAAMQMTLSPFASFQTDLLQTPGTNSGWSIYSVRAGLAVKFGKGKIAAVPVKATAPSPTTTPAIASISLPKPTFVPAAKEIQFSVRAPKLSLPVILHHELLPLLNAVFFESNAMDIPARYVALTKSSALVFTEDQLQQSDNAGNDRAKRQMNAYHNILNVLGSRMNLYPGATIALSGILQDETANRIMAENIRQYLVTVFSIDAARISIEPGTLVKSKANTSLLRSAEERRIDINSNFPEILAQVGELTITGNIATAPKENVQFTANNAGELFTTWSLQLTADDGTIQTYGAYQKDKVLIPAATILNNRQVGNYIVTMIGQTKNGTTITRESSLSLASPDKTKLTVPPFSVLFGFDRAVLTPAYEKFLTQIVSPMVGRNATVTILGYADATGADKYNLALSKARVSNVEKLLTTSLEGKAVIFKTYGFGKDKGIAPFGNTLPEERFYNRTILVGIDNGK